MNIAKNTKLHNVMIYSFDSFWYFHSINARYKFKTIRKIINKVEDSKLGDEYTICINKLIKNRTSNTLSPFF